MRSPESLTWRAAPRRRNLIPGSDTRESWRVIYPRAVPERRGLGEDGAEDGGNTEEGEGAEAHSAGLHLMVEVWWGRVLRARHKSKRALREA